MTLVLGHASLSSYPISVFFGLLIRMSDFWLTLSYHAQMCAVNRRCDAYRIYFLQYVMNGYREEISLQALQVPILNNIFAGQ